MLAIELVRLLRSFKIPCGTEERMQSEIEKILKSSGVEFEREFVISARDRIDFKVGPVGIECKIDGSPAKVLSQLLRYAEDSRIEELILVSSRHTHRFAVSSLGGKPFTVVRVAWI